MGLTQAEFDVLIADATKRIDGDLVWTDDEDHSPCVYFRAEVSSSGGWPLFVRGSYNPLIPAVSFALILKTTGRVYALDLGKAHHNPQCDTVGECHKHGWTEAFRDKVAFEPTDITATAERPEDAWREFCAEAAITHAGRLHAPPALKGELFP